MLVTCVVAGLGLAFWTMFHLAASEKRRRSWGVVPLILLMLLPIWPARQFDQLQREFDRKLQEQKKFDEEDKAAEATGAYAKGCHDGFEAAKKPQKTPSK